MSVYWNVGVLN